MKQRWMGAFNETPQSQGELFDVCKNRHRGNAESEAAFQSIKKRLNASQYRVFRSIKLYGDFGATNENVCADLNLTPNQVSPRITELKIAGKIEKIGTRPTRSGCSAAVWKAV